MCACTVCCSSLTCTMAAMSMGSMARGNRRMLKREMEVKAFSAVNTLLGLTPTNTANVARETCKNEIKDHPWPTASYMKHMRVLSSLTDICIIRCLHRATDIIEDSSHSFTLLPSGRHYWSIKTRTSRLLNSFFSRAKKLKQTLTRAGAQLKMKVETDVR